MKNEMERWKVRWRDEKMKRWKVRKRWKMRWKVRWRDEGIQKCIKPNLVLSHFREGSVKWPHANIVYYQLYLFRDTSDQISSSAHEATRLMKPSEAFYILKFSSWSVLNLKWTASIHCMSWRHRNTQPHSNGCKRFHLHAQLLSCCAKIRVHFSSLKSNMMMWTRVNFDGWLGKRQLLCWSLTKWYQGLSVDCVTLKGRYKTENKVQRQRKTVCRQIRKLLLDVMKWKGNRQVVLSYHGLLLIFDLPRPRAWWRLVQ